MHSLRNIPGLSRGRVRAIALAFWPASEHVAAEPVQSNYLVDVQIVMGTVAKFADETDNFHLTWRPDGELYGVYGDGWGSQPTGISKRAIGVSRISGDPPKLTGIDTWEGDAFGQSCCWTPWNHKSWGMIATELTRLHMWFTLGRPHAFGFTEARIATSADNGKSWTKASWAFTQADEMLTPSFLQVGRG